MVLADLAVRSSIVLALGLAIRAALRGRSAALRHRVLAATLFAAASVAPLGYILPAWSVPRSPRSVPATTTVAIETFRQTPVDRGTGSTVPPSALPLAAIVWSTGFGAGMAFLVLGIRRLEADRQARRAPLWSEPDAARRTHFDGLRSETARHAAPDRRTQSARDVGIAPVARAPADACSVWTEERAYTVLCHELAHIQRRDWIVQICGRSHPGRVLVQSADVARLRAACATTANRRATTSSCVKGSLRTHTQVICWSSHESAGGRVAHGHPRCSWRGRRLSKGELPPC